MLIKDIPTFEIGPRASELLDRTDELCEMCRPLIDGPCCMSMADAARMESIHATLAIEGNGMDMSVMRDVISGVTDEGSFDEVVEARNAARAFDEIEDADLWDVDDLLRIHDTLMFGCVEKPGFRDHDVCIADRDDNIIYVAPHFDIVEPMVVKLFDWCGSSELPAPVIGAVAHFYLESIHPFPDGNGRIGRLWHSVVLRRFDKVFDIAPMEPEILGRRQDYYDVLSRCQKDDAQDCTLFIEFCLDTCVSSLERLADGIGIRAAVPDSGTPVSPLPDEVSSHPRTGTPMPWAGRRPPSRSGIPPCRR